jgi:hypothetical protein
MSEAVQSSGGCPAGVRCRYHMRPLEPAISRSDYLRVFRERSGVRAHALSPDGTLVDDCGRLSSLAFDHDDNDNSAASDVKGAVWNVLVGRVTISGKAC